jgi:hypothetical protein
LERRCRLDGWDGRLADLGAFLGGLGSMGYAHRVWDFSGRELKRGVIFNAEVAEEFERDAEGSLRAGDKISSFWFGPMHRGLSH